MNIKVRIFNRTIEITQHRFSVYGFKNERTLNSVSYRKKDMSLKDIKDAFIYCIMPYKWLEKYFIR